MIAPPRKRPADLPDFERPPVTEVVLHVQFAAVDRFKTFHVGEIWNRFKKRYPVASEQAPIDPTFETFGTIARAPQGVQLQTFLAPPMPRYWFETTEGAELIQLQQDRMLHNWRKRVAEHVYPHYESLRDAFASEITGFNEFLEQEKLGSIKPNQCEVTYINTIELPDKSNPHEHLERVTSMWSDRQTQPYLPRAEISSAQARYVLGEEGKPFGRVHVVFTPAMRSTDNTPVIQLTITTRGKPRAETLESAFELLDTEREVVVQSFAAVTTRELHEFWGRKNA